MSEGLEARLDRIIGLLELAFAEPLSAARASARGDAVVAALLDRTEEWQPVGSLTSLVSTATGASARTIQRRLAELIEQRAMEAEGATASRKVRRTGLI